MSLLRIVWTKRMKLYATHTYVNLTVDKTGSWMPFQSLYLKAVEQSWLHFLELIMLDQPPELPPLDRRTFTLRMDYSSWSAIPPENLVQALVSTVDGISGIEIQVDSLRRLAADRLRQVAHSRKDAPISILLPSSSPISDVLPHFPIIFSLSVLGQGGQIVLEENTVYA